MMTKRQAPATAIPDRAYDRTPRLALVFTEETVWETQFDPKGQPVVTFPVAAHDIASAFNSATADSGLLPEHSLFWQRRQGANRIGIWLPPQVWKLTFEAGRHARAIPVPLPGLVFVGHGHEYAVFAVKARPARSEDLLYRAPLPNVDPSGRICQGSAEFPVCSADKIQQAVRAFFESTFNSHLSEHKVRSQGEADADADEEDDNEIMYEDEDMDPFEVAHNGARAHANLPPPRRVRRSVSLIQFLTGLQGKRAFPVRELVPSNLTLQTLIRRG